MMNTEFPMTTLDPRDLETLLRELQKKDQPTKKDYEALQKVLLDQALSLKNLVENNKKLELDQALTLNKTILFHVDKALKPKPEFKPAPEVPNLLKKHLLLSQQLKLTPEPERNKKRHHHDPFSLTPKKPQDR